MLFDVLGSIEQSIALQIVSSSAMYPGRFKPRAHSLYRPDQA